MLARRLLHRHPAAVPGGDPLALEFDGIDDCVHTAMTSWNGWPAVSVSVWVKNVTTALSEARILCKDRVGVAGAMMINYTSMDNLTMQIRAGGGWQSVSKVGAGLGTDVYHHLILAYDNAISLRGFLDLTLFDSVLAAGTIQDAPNESLAIGADSNFSSPVRFCALEGMDLRVYNRNLPSADRALLNSNPNGDVVMDYILRYDFSEGVVGQPASGVGSIIDQSANNYDGTPSGGPIYRAIT